MARTSVFGTLIWRIGESLLAGAERTGPGMLGGGPGAMKANTAAAYWVTALEVVLPCRYCRQSFRTSQAQRSLLRSSGDLAGRTAAPLRLCEFWWHAHNRVNAKLGRPHYERRTFYARLAREEAVGETPERLAEAWRLLFILAAAAPHPAPDTDRSITCPLLPLHEHLFWLGIFFHATRLLATASPVYARLGDADLDLLRIGGGGVSPLAAGPAQTFLAVHAACVAWLEGPAADLQGALAHESLFSRDPKVAYGAIEADFVDPLPPLPE